MIINIIFEVKLLHSVKLFTATCFCGE